MKRNISVICSLITFLIISGCGSGQSSGPSVTPYAGPFPVGDYKPVTSTGITSLHFFDDDTFKMLLPGLGELVIPGTYVVTSDNIVLNEPAGGPCGGFPGTYTWSFDGETLTLEAVEDDCPNPRAEILTRTWTKQP